MFKFITEIAKVHGLSTSTVQLKATGQTMYNVFNKHTSKITQNTKIGIKIFPHIIHHTQAFYIMYWNNEHNYPTQIFEAHEHDIQHALVPVLNGLSTAPGTPCMVFVESVLKSSVNANNSFAQSLLKQLLDKNRLSPKQCECVVGPSVRGTMSSTCFSKDPNFFNSYFSNAKKKKDLSVPIIKPEREFSLKPVKGDTVQLISTKEHKFYQYPFENFNPVQSLVFAHAHKDCNIIVGANTSAGKTICAEINMDHVLSQGKKVIYVSPLKALTQEKYEEWQARFPDKKIDIMTGDYSITEERAKELEHVDIICMTSEMVDSRTRKMQVEKNAYLYEVGLIILDESHIVGSESRGHALEVGLMRFTINNPSARILMLSATMVNIQEFATWASRLNGKLSEVVYCDWRPVVLDIKYSEYATNGSYFDTRDRKINAAVDIVLSKPTEKFIVFVHDKNTGKEIIKALSLVGIVAKFHNADVDAKNRNEIESSFKNRTGGLRVLVATSTLAWGVNLPARNVIVTGVHRGINEVDELDIIQMFGRAGRFGIDDAGFVFMLVPEGKTTEWKQRLTNLRPVESSLKRIEIIAFHVLGEIFTKNATNTEEIAQWFERSLAYVQNTEIEDEYIEQVLKDLFDMNMVTKRRTKNELQLTGLGNTSALMYYSPYDIHNWNKNFTQIFLDIKNPDNKLYAWALADIPSNRMDFIVKELTEEAQDLKNYLNGLGIFTCANQLSSIQSIMAAESALNGVLPHMSTIQAAYRNLTYDIDRMISALHMMDSMQTGWGFKWEDFGLKIKYGVGDELLDFVRIPGIGRKKALLIYEMGFSNIEQLAQANPTELMGEFTKVASQDIVKKAQSILKKKGKKK